MSASKTEITTAAVAILVHQGMTNQEIAARLGMRYNSVKAYVNRAGLKSNQAPRDALPACQHCRVVALCRRSVIAGGAFARAECNRGEKRP